MRKNPNLFTKCRQPQILSEKQCPELVPLAPVQPCASPTSVAMTEADVFQKK